MTKLLVSAIAIFASTSPAFAQSNRSNPTADYALINGEIHTWMQTEALQPPWE